MHTTKELQVVEKKYTRETALPAFRSGDTVIVHSKIKEGEKVRVQYIEGVVIRKSGSGSTKTFTLRKMSDGIGVEIIYPMNSEAVSTIEVVSHGDVRRSRLYYLRELTGKAARLKSKDGVGSAAEAASKASKAAAKAAKEVAAN